MTKLGSPQTCDDITNILRNHGMIDAKWQAGFVARQSDVAVIISLERTDISLCDECRVASDCPTRQMGRKMWDECARFE